jgi:hypothetical protein
LLKRVIGFSSAFSFFRFLFSLSPFLTSRARLLDSSNELVLFSRVFDSFCLVFFRLILLSTRPLKLSVSLSLSLDPLSNPRASPVCAHSILWVCFSLSRTPTDACCRLVPSVAQCEFMCECVCGLHTFFHFDFLSCVGRFGSLRFARGLQCFFVPVLSVSSSFAWFGEVWGVYGLCVMVCGLIFGFAFSPPRLCVCVWDFLITSLVHAKYCASSPARSFELIFSPPLLLGLFGLASQTAFAFASASPSVVTLSPSSCSVFFSPRRLVLPVFPHIPAVSLRGFTTFSVLVFSNAFRTPFSSGALLYRIFR